MNKKLITALLGLSLIAVPTVQAKRNNLDRFIDITKLGTLLTVTGGALIAAYKVYTTYTSVAELRKANTKLEEKIAQQENTIKQQGAELETVKKRVDNLEDTQKNLFAILKTIQGQETSFIESITNLWNKFTGNIPAVLAVK
ncbi:MAG: hypothetical protein M1114_06150 [Candidatus Dependentiae bacterium]|nr:hypothetical protein [Candidatus Dependentiae bacterium]